jgi:hypothetical protein
MTKSEIKQFLTDRGGNRSYEQRHGKPDAQKIEQVWTEAIAMHNKVTGKRLHRGCGSCHRTVWEWLQQS